MVVVLADDSIPFDKGIVPSAYVHTFSILIVHCDSFGGCAGDAVVERLDAGLCYDVTFQRSRADNVGMNVIFRISNTAVIPHRNFRPQSCESDITTLFFVRYRP